MHTKAGFSLVPVPGYLPNNNELEQRNAGQIYQMARDEVNKITREMQVIMQGDNKHPHINSGSFSHLRSFELNDMGFSLNKISPITFDMENPQTPADHGIKKQSSNIYTMRKMSYHKLTVKQQTSTRPTMNQVVTPHTIQTNPSQTKMSKEDSSHLKRITWLHSHSNSHHLRKAAKKTPSSTDHRHDRERSAQSHPSKPTDDRPQGSAPTAPTTQAGGLPQAPPATNTNRNHQDPPECNHTNGSTKASTQGQGATKSKKASETHPKNMTNTDPATQPSNTIICSGCGESGHWSRNCPYYNFCDFCRVTTHSTHMCRANKCGPGSPVCIYCGKSNHSFANCRYRPKDNWEELRHTPDAFRSGATGMKIQHQHPEIKLDQPTHNTNNNPFSHIDGRGQNQQYRGPQRSQPREQSGATPRGEQTDNNNQNFPPRRQQHTHFNKGYNRRYSPPTCSLHQHLTTP